MTSRVGQSEQRLTQNLTAELVALVERIEPDPGPEPGTADHTDAEFKAMAEAVRAKYKPEDRAVADRRFGRSKLQEN
jgi:cation transport protein ChaC